MIVVTGAAGLLGSAFARGLAEQGARVALLDLECRISRSPVGPDRVEPAERFLCVPADVTKRTDLESALAAIVQKWGNPSGLVNCAAIDTRPDAPAEDNGPFENLVEQVFDATMAVNVKGVVLCCQVFGGAMARAGLGSIVNIASIYGMVAPDQDIYQYRRDQGDVFYKPIGYSVSKSALYNLTRYLAVYWGKQQVRVNTLTLGGVKNLQDQRFIEKYEAKVPLGRMAQPEDYVGAVAFLMSDASRYLTGANIVIDGGYTAL